MKTGNQTTITIDAATASTVDIPNNTLTELDGYAEMESRASMTSVTLPDTIQVVFDDPTGKMAAIAENAENDTKSVDAGSQIDLERNAPAAGEEIHLDPYHMGVSNLVIVRKNGDDASAWVTATAYAEGDYVVPTVSNGHFYKATVGGTSDATEPTWPTDGSTVVDSGVTWKDMGLIEASSTTDYLLLSGKLGVVQIRTGTSFEYDEPLLCSYDYLGHEFDRNKANQKVDTYGAVKFFGENKMTGERLARYWYDCHIVGTSSKEFGLANNMSWSVTITRRTPDQETHPELPSDYQTGDKEMELSWEESCQ
jgi:hypothetical protein